MIHDRPLNPCAGLRGTTRSTRLRSCVVCLLALTAPCTRGLGHDELRRRVGVRAGDLARRHRVELGLRASAETSLVPVRLAPRLTKAERTGAREMKTCAEPLSLPLPSTLKRLLITRMRQMMWTFGKKTNACVEPPLLTLMVTRKTSVLGRQLCPLPCQATEGRCARSARCCQDVQTKEVRAGASR